MSRDCPPPQQRAAWSRRRALLAAPAVLVYGLGYPDREAEAAQWGGFKDRDRRGWGRHGPRCDLRLLQDGGLILEAFPWDGRNAQFDVEPAEVRIQIRGQVTLWVGKPRLIEAPRGLRGRAKTEIRGRWGRHVTGWMSAPDTFRLREPGGVLALQARVRPLQGQGLPAGRYRARVALDCRP